MSDDVPFLFADEIARPKAPARRVVFLSAMSAAQMQQYTAGGWTVIAGPGFQAANTIDLASVPAQAGTSGQRFILAMNLANAASCVLMTSLVG